MKREFELPVAGPALSPKELQAPGLPITFCLGALWILIACLLPEGPDLVAMILATFVKFWVHCQHTVGAQ